MEIRIKIMPVWFLKCSFCTRSSLVNKIYQQQPQQQQKASFPCSQAFKTMESETAVIVMTVREILDLCKTDAVDLDSMRRSYIQQAGSVPFPDQLNDHLYWSYKVLHSDDISPRSVKFWNFASIFSLIYIYNSVLKCQHSILNSGARTPHTYEICSEDSYRPYINNIRLTF